MLIPGWEVPTNSMKIEPPQKSNDSTVYWQRTKSNIVWGFISIKNPLKSTINQKKNIGISYYLPSLTDTGAPSLATNITLLKASEVDAIFEGNDDMFKTVSINSDSSYQM